MAEEMLDAALMLSRRYALMVMPLRGYEVARYERQRDMRAVTRYSMLRC